MIPANCSHLEWTVSLVCASENFIQCVSVEMKGVPIYFFFQNAPIHSYQMLADLLDSLPRVIPCDLVYGFSNQQCVYELCAIHH